MKRYQFPYKRWALRRWECSCGRVWELLLSPLFPERYIWAPVCGCGGKR